MAKWKQQKQAEAAPVVAAVRSVPVVVAPLDTTPALDGGEWFRMRLITENGVRGWVVERLTYANGQPVTQRVHEVDMRDVTVGKYARTAEMSALGVLD